MLNRLLNFLLNHLLFAGTMFFAAGTVVGDVSGGGSDGGVDTGADNGSSNGDTESVTGEDVGGGDNQSTTVDDAGDVSKQSDPNALVDSGDGRKIPQKYAELFKTDKALREMFFSQASLRKEFPGGVKEALALKKNVEEIGGLEAVEQLQGDLQRFTSDAELFEKDQAKWIESSFAENSDASLKAMGHAIDFAAEHHPEQYNHMMSKVLLNTLDQYSPVGNIWTLLSGMKDNPQAQQAAQELAKWYNGVKNTAAKIPEKKVDAESKKLETERQKLTEEKEQIRNQKINSEAVPYLIKSAESQIDAKAKASGIDIQAIKRDTPKRYEKFMQDVKQSIHRSVLADNKFIDRYAAALAAGDTAKCTRMVNARHDLAIKGDGHKEGVISGLVEEWFGPGKKVNPVADKTKPVTDTSNRGGNTSAVRVASMPPKTDINWNHPKTRIVDGEAMMKNGKFLKWRD